MQLDLIRNTVVEGEKPKTNELSVMLKPYLTPKSSLLDMSEGKSRRPVRLKESIKFGIEPMPSKIKFRF